MIGFPPEIVHSEDGGAWGSVEGNGFGGFMVFIRSVSLKLFYPTYSLILGVCVVMHVACGMFLYFFLMIFKGTHILVQWRMIHLC